MGAQIRPAVRQPDLSAPAAMTAPQAVPFFPAAAHFAAGSNMPGGVRAGRWAVQARDRLNAKGKWLRTLGPCQGLSPIRAGGAETDVGRRNDGFSTASGPASASWVLRSVPGLGRSAEADAMRQTHSKAATNYIAK
jgi:hypothetical protein